jgi:Amt family ammonium transporter
MVGMLLTGVFATGAINSVVADNGLFYGEWKLFSAHIIGLIGSTVFILVMAFILLKITDMISSLRVSDADEEVGLDISQHGEKL